MAVLTIAATSSGQALDPDAAQSFRLDLEREVGAVEGGGVRSPGAKGIDPGLAAVAVAIVSSPALAALVNLLKTWFERDRSLELKFIGPGGEVHIKGADARRLGAVDLARLIDRAMGEEVTADAPGGPDRR